MIEQSAESLPKKILIIKDLAYILPEDFTGTFDDALIHLVQYKKLHERNKKVLDDESSAQESLLLHGGEAKVCGKYGIFELRDGNYIQI